MSLCDQIYRVDGYHPTDGKDTNISRLSAPKNQKNDSCALVQSNTPCNIMVVDVV